MGYSNTNIFESEREYQERLIQQDKDFLRWQRDMMEAEKEYEWERSRL